MQTEQVCERCQTPAHETEMGVLAYNGSKLVCSDCDDALTNEWVAEDPRHVHPLDTLANAIERGDHLKEKANG